MSSDSPPDIAQIARRAKEASWLLASTDTETRNSALKSVLEALEKRRDAILAQNALDLADGEKLVDRGEMAAPLQRRLDLRGDKFGGVLDGIRDLLQLEDPLGRVDYAMRLDDGLELRRISCPIGVIGVIFESRPDAAVQIATLAIKSGNAVLLKGGREAARTNAALVEAIREGLRQADLPVDAVANLATREEAQAMLSLDDSIDLIIPRGSNELVQSIQANTRIPVLGHADGICAVYVDASADLDRAIRVVVDSKTQYPAVCNAAETLLVHRDAASRVLPELASALRKAGVELRGDPRVRELVDQARPATADDWRTEYLDLVMAVRIVDSLADAIAHINRHGSHHTDAIVTEDPAAAREFQSLVDSASVFHNASTRFADGFRFGFGAEVGVSTCKTHARGPVGLEGLVIYKYHLTGDGHRVADYGPGKRSYRHERLDG